VQDESTIWLVGMMGSGKSTVGPLLADRLGCAFLDLDHEIERRAGSSIPTLFADQGEAQFRRLERQCIEDVATHVGVVALGGGAIAQPGIAEILAATGRVVYLKASPEQLMARLGRGGRRPLLAGLDAGQRLEKLTQLFDERRVHYEGAEIELEVGGRDAADTLEELVQRLS